MELQITTLIENQPDDEGALAFEHGLSLYIEFRGKRLLFDTGQTGAFTENARRLGVDLSRLDAVILSHGHYDHSGGLPRLLPLLSPETPLYMGREFFALKYKKEASRTDERNPGETFRYNGNPFPREILDAYPVRLELLDADVTWLSPDILLFKNFRRDCPFETPNPSFFIGDPETSGGFRPDAFDDEIALGLLTEKGLVLLSGCAHPGIVNMLTAAADRTDAPLYAAIGGTHLIGAGEERIQRTLRAFRELELTAIAVSHCTGARGETLIQEAFPGSFIRNNTGNVYCL